MFNVKSNSIVSAMLFAVSSLGMSAMSHAASAPSLGAAGSFAVFAGSSIQNIGATVISGDLGVNPSAVLTGFPPGTVTNGAIHLADALSYQAQFDAAAAGINLGAQKSDRSLSGSNLGGMTLTSGVYYYSGFAELNGNLILDASNDSSAVFIFQIVGSFKTWENSTITMINGGKSSNVFFMIGNSAELGLNSSFIGSLITTTNITMLHGARVDGKAIALIGDVVLDENTITNFVVDVPNPDPLTIFKMDCNFSLSAKKAPMTCTVLGSVCIDGEASCSESNIANDLNVTCSDGYNMVDLAANRSISGTTLSMQGHDGVSSVAIDFNYFNNKAETLSSYLNITLEDGSTKGLSGSCILE